MLIEATREEQPFILDEEGYKVWQDDHSSFRRCNCGHARSVHTGYSGPNSNGKSNFNECTVNSSSIPPYRVGGCNCHKYKFSLIQSITGLLTHKPEKNN